MLNQKKLAAYSVKFLICGWACRSPLCNYILPSPVRDAAIAQEI